MNPLNVARFLHFTSDGLFLFESKIKCFVHLTSHHLIIGNQGQHVLVVVGLAHPLTHLWIRISLRTQSKDRHIISQSNSIIPKNSKTPAHHRTAIIGSCGRPALAQHKVPTELSQQPEAFPDSLFKDVAGFVSRLSRSDPIRHVWYLLHNI